MYICILFEWHCCKSHLNNLSAIVQRVWGLLDVGIVITFHSITNRCDCIALQSIATLCMTLHWIGFDFDFEIEYRAREQTNIFAVNTICYGLSKRKNHQFHHIPFSWSYSSTTDSIKWIVSIRIVAHKHCSTNAAAVMEIGRKLFYQTEKFPWKIQHESQIFFFFFRISFAFHRSTSSSSFLCQISRKYY